MKLNQIQNTTTRQQIEELLNKVTQMKEEEFKEFLNKLPFTNYSLYNTILIAIQGGSQVAGFHTWKKLKRSIIKGSRAIYILAPCIYNKKTKENKEEKILTGFRSIPVFDISQTKGEPITRGFTTEIKTDFSIQELSKKLGIKTKYKKLEISKGGYITHITNEIVLNSNLDEAENKGTFIHECSHYLLGHTKEGQTTSSDNKERSLKEQEAETLTYLICKRLGINRKSEFYLKAWNTQETILNSLDKINKAFSTFIEILKTKQEATQ